MAPTTKEYEGSNWKPYTFFPAIKLAVSPDSKQHFAPSNGIRRERFCAQDLRSLHHLPCPPRQRARYPVIFFSGLGSSAFLCFFFRLIFCFHSSRCYFLLLRPNDFATPEVIRLGILHYVFIAVVEIGSLKID